MFTAALNSVVRAGVKAAVGKETFEDVKDASTGEVIVAILFISLVVVITLLIGKWLWNSVLCKHVTIVKPVDSVFTVLLIMIAIDWFLPTNNVVCAC
tara:strand:+ start:106 stop:396 length:291 start_codon:yes stop_codon:yes gene_type:complete